VEGQTFHFQTQLSDGNLVIEEYYLNNNHGFGSYWKVPVGQPTDPMTRTVSAAAVGMYRASR